MRVRSLCFRSQKKTAAPYRVSAVLTHDGFIDECACECAARENGACHHVVALLKLLVLLKGQGYEEAPPELSCTELPQKWRRPRGQKIPACSVDEIDWRSARRGGITWAIGSRLYEARKKRRSVQDVEVSARKFGSELAAHAASPFINHLQCMPVRVANSTYGETCEGSLLWCQKPLVPHDFSTHMSPDIQVGVKTRGATATPSRPTFFSSSSVFPVSSVALQAAETSILEASI